MCMSLKELPATTDTDVNDRDLKGTYAFQYPLLSFNIPLYKAITFQFYNANIL